MLASRIGRRVTILLLGLIAGAFLIDGVLIEPNRLVRTELEIPCPSLVSHPVKILLFSDVNFVGIGARERAIQQAARELAPDLVLVAGDFFERSWQVNDPALLVAAAEFFTSLPAPAGRFLAPGEQETSRLHRLRRAWTDGAIEVLSNEERTLEIAGERVDLFVADPTEDPAPWTTGAGQGRTFLQSRGRFRDQLLVYTGEGASEWRDVDITFAFQALDSRSQIDLRFSWAPGMNRTGGTGWRLVRHEYSPDFRLQRYSGSTRYRSGRWESGFVPPAGVWCRARVLLSDPGPRAHVRAKFWKESDPEPELWSIDAEDGDPARNRGGTVAFAGRAGGRRYANLRVAEPDGHSLLEEDFADPKRLRTVWRFESALADWLFRSPALSGTATRERGARILLAHDPDIVLDVADLNSLAGAADAPTPCLILAGHTHGGQLRIPWFGSLYSSTRLGRRYDKGLLAFRGIPLFVTSGVGTTVLPVRLFDPPEVVLLTLTPVSKAPGQSEYRKSAR